MAAKKRAKPRMSEPDPNRLMSARNPKKRYPADNVRPQRPAKKAASRLGVGSSGAAKTPKPLQISPVGQSTTGSWSRSKPKNIPSGYRLQIAMSYPPKYRLVKNRSRRSR